MAKRSKSNKITLLIIGGVLIIGIICVIIFILPKIDNTKNNNAINNNLESELKLPTEIEFENTEDTIVFYCNHSEMYGNSNYYEKGSDVYCKVSFNISENSSAIKEIWGEFSYDEDIEYVGTYKISESWNLTQNNNKFKVTTPEATHYADGFYQLKFKVKPSTKKEELTINFKNIILKKENNKYYKLDDSIVKLIITDTSNYKIEYGEKTEDGKQQYIFYKFDNNEGYKEINRYICEYDDCSDNGIVDIYGGYTDLEKGKDIIFDGRVVFDNLSVGKFYWKKVIFYDFEKGIKNQFNDIVDLIIIRKKGDYLPSGVEGFMLRTKDEKYAIIDNDGNYIKELSDKKFTFEKIKIGGNTLVNYSLEDDMIVSIKDNKYGIEKIYSNDNIINHIYDDIKIYDNKLFKAKTNDKYYLYSFETKDKITKGYDNLYLLDNNILLVKIDDYMYIKDFTGNNLTETSIKLEDNIRSYEFNKEGMFFNKRDDIISISFVYGKDSGNNVAKDKYLSYEYNIKTKELTKTQEVEQ